jgi:hypothetical protein
MNDATRSIVVMVCLGFCAGGLIATSREPSIGKHGALGFFSDFDTESSYQFAAGDLHKFSFGQLEEIIRADAAVRFPRARIEFGSAKVEHGMLTMPVVLFGPDHAAQAFLYKLVPDKNSWKITDTQRLWFVSPSQIVRGLRV